MVSFSCEVSKLSNISDQYPPISPNIHPPSLAVALLPFPSLLSGTFNLTCPLLAWPPCHPPPALPRSSVASILIQACILAIPPGPPLSPRSLEPDITPFTPTPFNPYTKPPHTPPTSQSDYHSSSSFFKEPPSSHADLLAHFPSYPLYVNCILVLYCVTAQTTSLQVYNYGLPHLPFLLSYPSNTPVHHPATALALCLH